MCKFTQNGVGLEEPSVLFCQTVSPTWIGYVCVESNVNLTSPVLAQGKKEVPEFLHFIMAYFQNTPDQE